MTKIQVRRGAAASWTTANPTLDTGEIGFETDTKKLKIGDGSTAWSSLSYFSGLAFTPVDSADVGANSGICPLDSSGLVASAYLPSYVDDVLEYANVAAMPGTGTSGKIYVALDSGKIYRWSGSAYIEISPSPGSTDSVTEGSTNLYYTNSRADARISAAVGSTVVGYGGALGTPSSGVVTNCTGQVADLSIVAFGANTTRATGTGDFSFGVKLQRGVTLTSVTYRVATADASGSSVFELKKNGTSVSGSSATVAAASQVAGGTATGSWSFAAGDIVTVNVVSVGTTPGKGLIADITGVTV